MLAQRTNRSPGRDPGDDLLAFGEGLKLQLDKNRRSTGENLAVMWPSETTKAWKGMPPGRAIRLRIDDVDFIRERMPELKAVHGELNSGRTPAAIFFAFVPSKFAFFSSAQTRRASSTTLTRIFRSTAVR